MHKKIVTSGVDSEYVLSDLSNYLRQEGYQVLEIDFGNFSGDVPAVLSQFKEDKVTYITSAHPNFTLRMASSLAPSLVSLYPNCLAPIEIIPLLQPQSSIFVPHDLLTPFGVEYFSDIRFMGIFDHILAPINVKSLQATWPATTKVHDAGWIKYTKNIKKRNKKPSSDNEIKILLFISMIEYLKVVFGIDGLVEYLRPLLSSNIKIKFPAWKGIDEIELAFEQAGWNVISSDANSTELIAEADIVICNSASSIHAESSLMGVPTICLLEAQGFSSTAQVNELKHLPNIYFHDYQQRAPISQSVLKQLMELKSAPLIRPFDYELVKKIIESDNNKI